MRAWLVREGRLFWTATTVLTRLPAPRLRGFEETWLPRSVVYFPVVGLWVGLLAAAAYWLAARLWPAGPSNVAALLAVAVAALATGGLHEDGWADLFDALAASRDRERMLEVMKDSRIGAAGALALVLLLGAKLAALAALAARPAASVPAALVAAHVLSRWSHLPLLWRLPYVRNGGGLTGALAGRVPAARLALGTAFTLVTAALALRWAALPAVVMAAGATAAAGWLFRARLGGITGDCLGAANQLVEVGTLLILAAHWPPYPS